MTEHTSLSVFKGTYKGPWWRGFEGSLGRMVTEVDTYVTYLNLHKLQKSGYFPKLISWGFICGAMFAYVMPSDDGMSRHQRLTDEQPLMRKCCGRLENVRVALHELHKRGILHGDVDISKVVFQQEEDGASWVAKLIGFAESKHVNVTDPDDAQANGLEKAKLAEVVEDLTSGEYVG